MSLLSSFQATVGTASAVAAIVDTAFENACIYLVTLAFNRLKSNKKYTPAWKENRFSAHLIGYMRDIRQEENIYLRVDPENHIYKESILDGIEDPDTAARIDIKVSGAWVTEDIYYGIEAKLLVEHDWMTKDAYELRARYIETGIDNYVNGIYSDKVNIGCIVGYIIEGDPSSVALQINKLLIHRKRHSDQLIEKHTVNSCDCCYKSKHIRKTDEKTFTIRHLLLNCG